MCVLIRTSGRGEETMAREGRICLCGCVFVGEYGIELTCQVTCATKPPVGQPNGVYPGICMESDRLVQIGIGRAEV